MKIEMWNGHEIRFVSINGEWWAVAKDVTSALGILSNKDAVRKMDSKYKGAYKIPTLGGYQEMIVLNEKGMYRLIMRSNKKEAEQFQDWVFDVIKELRQSNGLEGFEIFRMLDKEHQKQAMQNLKKSLKKPVRVNFIKANTVSNKAISIMYGFPKMIKKNEMSPEMLVDRQNILDDTVELMGVKEKYGLKLSVSDEIYSRLTEQRQPA